DRVGVGKAPVRQELADEVVEKKALRRLGRRRVEIPRAGALADRVPGPDGAGLDAGGEADPRRHRPVAALDLDEVAVGEAEPLRGRAMDVEAILGKDLAQPGV